MKIEDTQTRTIYEYGRVRDRYITFHEFANSSWSDPKLKHFYRAFDKAKMELMEVTRNMLPEAVIKEEKEVLTVYLTVYLNRVTDEAELAEWIRVTEKIYREYEHEAMKADDGTPIF